MTTYQRGVQECVMTHRRVSKCVMTHRRVSECVVTHRRVSHEEIRDPSQQAVKQTQSRSGARFTSGPCTTCRRGLLVAMDSSQHFKQKSAKKNKKRFSHRSVLMSSFSVSLTYHHWPIPPRLAELKPSNGPESAKHVLNSTGGSPTHSVELDCVGKK